jgi:hypothetical protein
MSALEKLRKQFKKATQKESELWLEEVPAWMGDKDGQVTTGIAGMVYVRTVEGQLLEVFNNTAPAEPNLLIKIGRRKDQPDLWQVIGRREVWEIPGTSSVVHHHEQHEFMAPDMVMLDRRQISQLSVLVRDAAAFTVQVIGAFVHTANGIAEISSQVVDLSGELGSDNAVFVNIECDDDGVLSLHKGTDFGSPYVASVSHIPVPDPGKYLLATVLLYLGQETLLNEYIRVPMPLGSSYFGNMSKSIYDTDDDGIVDEAEHALTADAAGDPNRFLAVYNYYIGSGTPGYKLALAHSADGRSWSIEDEPVLDLGTATEWDDETLQFPNLLQVDGVLYLYYAGKDDTGWDNFKIGLAQSFDGGATWVRHASNPLIDNDIAWENTNVFGPVVLYDKEETDSAKRWKMWYAGSSFGEGIGYAYSADGIAWTKAAGNPVVDLGTGWEDTYIMPDAVIRRGNEFILFYSGNDGSGTWSAGYATFSDPEGTYTKSANNPILEGDGITTTLTSDLTSGSTTAAVSDATVFPIGCPVWIGGATRFLTHVIARNSSTSLELADEAPATIASGQIVRSVAYNSIDITGVRYDDGYKFTITPHQPDGGSETGVHELTMLGYANDDLDQAYIDYSAGVQIPVSLAESQNTSVSRENWSLLDTQETEERHKPAGQSVTFNDGEGDPADVTSGSASDGTSDYAARRDHVHHTDATGGQYRQFVYDVVGDDVDILTEDGDAVFDLTDLE